MDWNAIRAAIASLSLPDRQRMNLLDLIAALQRFDPPSRLTITCLTAVVSLCWENYEISTHDSMYETHAFKGLHTYIRHWPRTADEPIP